MTIFLINLNYLVLRCFANTVQMLSKCWYLSWWLTLQWKLCLLPDTALLTQLSHFDYVIMHCENWIMWIVVKLTQVGLELLTANRISRRKTMGKVQVLILLLVLLESVVKHFLWVISKMLLLNVPLQHLPTVSFHLTFTMGWLIDQNTLGRILANVVKIGLLLA